MISTKVYSRDGSEAVMTVSPGGTLVEALRQHGFDEVLAMCGGCCACATCHVYVELGPPGIERSRSADEDDLLDSSEHRKHNSRLACQIRLEETMQELVIRIAPED